MLDYHSDFRLPDRMETPDGSIRRVGVELEFAVVSARDGAELVYRLFGGTIERQDAHRFKVVDTSLGDFVCELDSQYVHGKGLPGEHSKLDKLLTRFRGRFRELLGDVSSLVVPCEIVCPPVQIDKLHELHGLVGGLRDAGASGTRDNLLYAFGAQLNPELPDHSGAYIASVLKAYVLLSDWLRGVIDVDPTRWLTSFADPFPKAYVRKLLKPDYDTDRDHVIADYLAFNPTRNRELDLLPLFARLEPEKVQSSCDDPLIKPRPTFHYRLPDARLDEENWSVALEWNRWLMVEKLAAQPDLLAAMAKDYLACLDSRSSPDWALKSSEWLLLS